MMHSFQVKPIGPAFNPNTRYVRVQAETAKEAAEQLIGRTLTEAGDALDERARVKLGGDREASFYLPS